MKRKMFTDAEVAEVEDYTDIGRFARDGVDNLVEGVIAYQRHWAGFGVSQASAVSLSVSAGTLFSNDKTYRNDVATVIPVQTYLPIIGSDHKFIAILADGATVTETGSRLVEIDADTEETVSQTLPLVENRKVNFTIVQGAASPTPVKPAIPGDRCCIAFVELSNTAIIAIEINQELRAKPLAEVETRLRQAEGEIDDVAGEVTGLKSTLASITARLGDIPSPTIIRQMKKDIGAFRVQLKTPADARAYWFDPGLTTDAWDVTSPSFLARIREGVRFPFAAVRDAQLALLNNDDPGIKIRSGILLPNWTEELRLEVGSDGGSVNISDQVHTIINARQRAYSREVIEYGPAVMACTNNAYWANYVRGLHVGSIFTAYGQEFEVTGVYNYEADGVTPHAFWIKKITRHTIQEVRWEYFSTEVGLNGSIHGQSWLQGQAAILTSIELQFIGVGANGDVHLCVAECSENGAPNITNVIARKTLAAGSLAVGWTKFDLPPTLLEAGKRYTWFTVTTGNHALGTVAGNKFAQGSRWTASDGAWAQATLDSDFAMRLNFAKFAAMRTVVGFQSLLLDNGMTELRMLWAGWQAAGVPVVWEIKKDGSDWQSLTLDNPNGADDLMGLPAIVQLRAVFNGTAELQPAIVLDATARGMTFRSRGDFVAVSDSIAFGVSTTFIQTETELDAFDPAKHTFAPKLIIGATIYTPSATTVTVDPYDPKKRTVLASFTVPSSNAARYRADMTSTEVTDTPFITTAFMTAL